MSENILTSITAPVSAIEHAGTTVEVNDALTCIELKPTDMVSIFLSEEQELSEEFIGIVTGMIMLPFGMDCPDWMFGVKSKLKELEYTKQPIQLCLDQPNNIASVICHPDDEAYVAQWLFKLIDVGAKLGAAVTMGKDL